MYFRLRQRQLDEDPDALLEVGVYDWDEQNLPGDLMGRFTLKLSEVAPDAKRYGTTGKTRRDPSTRGSGRS